MSAIVLPSTSGRFRSLMYQQGLAVERDEASRGVSAASAAGMPVLLGSMPVPTQPIDFRWLFLCCPLLMTFAYNSEIYCWFYSQMNNLAHVCVWFVVCNSGSTCSFLVCYQECLYHTLVTDINVSVYSVPCLIQKVHPRLFQSMRQDMFQSIRYGAGTWWYEDKFFDVEFVNTDCVVSRYTVSLY